MEFPCHGRNGILPITSRVKKNMYTYIYIHIYTKVYIKLTTPPKKTDDVFFQRFHLHKRFRWVITFPKDFTPGRLTWNIIIGVWKIIFLSEWVICRFHVNLPGCHPPCCSLQVPQVSLLLPPSSFQISSDHSPKPPTVAVGFGTPSLAPPRGESDD